MDNSSQWETKKWVTVERPGPLGKSKDAKYREWDDKYGKGMWRIDFEGKDGQPISFEQIVSEYVRGYKEYFEKNPLEARFITEHYSHVYDKDPIDQNTAFDIYALYDAVDTLEQFRHTAINIALVELGYEFQGSEPLQIELSAKSIQTEDPLIILYCAKAPEEIFSSRPELIPDINFPNRWWGEGSIEDFYQSCKVLKVLE